MTRLPFVLVALAAFSSLTDVAHAGPGGGVVLTVGELVPGNLGRVTVSGLQPGQATAVFLSTTGTGRGPCAPGGGCLGILAPTQIATGVANADGYFSVQLRVPANVALGTPVWFDAAAAIGGGAADTSPVVSTTVDGLFCPGLYSPVCGIDGVTYSNDCYAGVAGWPVDYPGHC